MCNIIILKPGQMPVKSDLFNMCYNNWHSFGLVSEVDGKLDVVREVPENNEVDPERVLKLLSDNRQYKRYLHVRHNTVGATSLENTHPFDVYYDSKSGRTVLFMHNGTLHEYKGSYIGGAYQSYSTSDNTGDSDTKRFTEEVLQKFAPLCKGDFSGEAMTLMLKKFWPMTGNRGLIITNDIDPILLGDWKKRKDDNGEEYPSANDEYFDKVTRGPAKLRLELEEKKRKEAEEKARPSNTVVTNSSFRKERGEIYQLPADFPYSWPRYPSVFEIRGEVGQLLGDTEFWTGRDASICVGALTRAELEKIYEDKESCLGLMMWIFAEYSQQYDDTCKLKDKNENASKLIASLTNELKVLKEQRGLLN